MSTQDISRDEWAAFFDGFNLRHQGWLVTVDVFGSDIGAQVEARGLPLQGITAELKREGEDAISIIVGDTPQQHVTHTHNRRANTSNPQTDRRRGRRSN